MPKFASRVPSPASSVAIRGVKPTKSWSSTTSKTSTFESKVVTRTNKAVTSSHGSLQLPNDTIKEDSSHSHEQESGQEKRAVSDTKDGSKGVVPVENKEDEQGLADVFSSTPQADLESTPEVKEEQEPPSPGASKDAVQDLAETLVAQQEKQKTKSTATEDKPETLLLEEPKGIELALAQNQADPPPLLVSEPKPVQKASSLGISSPISTESNVESRSPSNVAAARNNLEKPISFKAFGPPSRSSFTGSMPAAMTFAARTTTTADVKSISGSLDATQSGTKENDLSHKSEHAPSVASQTRRPPIASNFY